MGNGMNKILPGLYVGNFRDSKDQQQLTEHNITHILAIHDNARKLPCNSDKEYLCIIASDSPGQNLTQFFPVCNDFIHSTRLHGGNVLIHCLAGMSRSVTVTVAYMMCVTSLNWRDCLKAVQGSRSVANPNVGFLKQLQEFDKERLQEEKNRLRDKFPDTHLSQEDESAAKDLLALYYHFMSVGEMCEGNCPPGTSCPRGLCRSNRSFNILRCYQRELLSSSQSGSKSVKENPPDEFPFSPNRNISPRRRDDTPLDSYIFSLKNYSPNDRRLAKDVDNSEDASIMNDSPIEACPAVRPFSYGTPINVGKPFGYYTSSSAKSSPTHQMRNASNFQGPSSYSPSYSSHKGKVLYCPSTPSSPPKSLNRQSSVTLDSSGSSSSSMSKSKRPLKYGANSGSTSSLNSLQTGQFDNSSSERKKKSKKSPVSKENLRNVDSCKNSNPQEGIKSKSSTSTPTHLKGLVDHPIRLNFRQTVKRLFPHITALQSISKQSKNTLMQTEASCNSSLPNLSSENDKRKQNSEIPDSSENKAYNIYFDKCGDNYRHLSDDCSIKISAVCSPQSEGNLQKAVISEVGAESAGFSVKANNNTANYSTSICKDGYFTTLQDDILYVETASTALPIGNHSPDHNQSTFTNSGTYPSRPSETSTPPPIPPRRLSYSVASGSIVPTVPPVPPREKKAPSYYQD